MDNTERFIPVQICYAEPENQILIDLEVPENTRLIDAVNLSRIEKKTAFGGKRRQYRYLRKEKKVRYLTESQ